MRIAFLTLPLIIACGDDETTTSDTDTTPDTTDTTPPDPTDPPDTTDTMPTMTGYAFATDDPSAYARVDRMGMPAVATAVIVSKDDYNAADPTDDVAGTFVGEITASVDFLHSALDDDLALFGLEPCDTATCVGQAAPFVVPDAIAVDTSASSGFPNGRKLEDQVVDVTLALILLDLAEHGVTTLAGVPINPAANDVAFPGAFPYLAPAH